MSKEFIPYEEALALKELGFNEKCYGYYTEYKEYFYFDVDDLSSAYTKNMDNLIVNSVDDLKCKAPLYQQAFRWFREKYGLFSEINLTTKQEDVKEFEFFVLNVNEPLFESDDYKKYEEAELACLRKLIELLKSKQR